MGCIFCEILAGDRPAHMIYEDSDHVAFLDRYPYDRGHSLLIPRRHHERITEMDPDAVGRMFSLVPRLAAAILDETGATGFSLGQNNGREARQIIPHVHVHIIARYGGRGAVWSKRIIADDSDLKNLARAIGSRL